MSSTFLVQIGLVLFNSSSSVNFSLTVFFLDLFSPSASPSSPTSSILGYPSFLSSSPTFSCSSSWLKSSIDVHHKIKCLNFWQTLPIELNVWIKTTEQVLHLELTKNTWRLHGKALLTKTRDMLLSPFLARTRLKSESFSSMTNFVEWPWKAKSEFNNSGRDI